LGTEIADFENIKGQKSHDEIKREGNSQLGNGNEKYALIDNFGKRQASHNLSPDPNNPCNYSMPGLLGIKTQNPEIPQIDFFFPQVCIIPAGLSKSPGESKFAFEKA
jgi:hypothetical protein